jgi:NAD(P)-dependent dehydrogenase (short-subunit alcohol dehydrogenase family)
MVDWADYAPPAESLDNRVILVTGSTSGIGRAVARSLIDAGATVILHGRNPAALEAAFQEFRSRGREPSVAVLDLERAQGSDYQALTQAVEDRYGRLDGLLHNAGILGNLSPIEHYDIALWQRVVHVNLNAAFILTRCLLPLLRASEDASIVFTTSTVGHVGRAYWGAYAASKFGIEGLAQVLADELENTPIRVNCINPGATRTAMRRKAYPAEDRDALRRPEDITGPYLYLLGADSRNVRGELIDCQPSTASRRR